MKLFEDNGAYFSECKKHRLLLWRIWEEERDLIMFIGLNPSTADAYTDDATIRRVKAIAFNLGFGGIYMTNLFTYISTDPKLLNIDIGNHADADTYLKKAAYNSKVIVCAWGNFNVMGRDKIVKVMFPVLHALHINKNGSPKHPLYCRADSKLIKF